MIVARAHGLVTPKKLYVSAPVEMFLRRMRTTNGVNRLKKAHWIPNKLPFNKFLPWAARIVRTIEGYFLLLQQQKNGFGDTVFSTKIDLHRFTSSSYALSNAAFILLARLEACGGGMSAVGARRVLLVGCLGDRNGVLECQRTDWCQLSLVPTLHQRREKCKK